VAVDVDLDDDGTFAGDELGRDAGALSANGTAVITLGELPSPWTGWIRARVVDLAGNEGVSAPPHRLRVDTSLSASITLELVPEPSGGLGIPRDARLRGQLFDLDYSVAGKPVGFTGLSGSATSDSSGAYSLDAPLPDGDYTVTAFFTDHGGITRDSEP